MNFFSNFSNAKKTILLVGSIILLFSVFTPAIKGELLQPISVTILKAVPLFGVLILIVSIVSMVLIFLEKYKIIGVGGIIGILSGIVALLHTQTQITNLGKIGKPEFKTILEEIIYEKMLAELIKNISLAWGWYVVFLGFIILSISMFFSSEKRIKLQENKLEVTEENFV